MQLSLPGSASTQRQLINGGIRSHSKTDENTFSGGWGDGSESSDLSSPAAVRALRIQPETICCVLLNITNSFLLRSLTLYGWTNMNHTQFNWTSGGMDAVKTKAFQPTSRGSGLKTNNNSEGQSQGIKELV